jgi:hypothetical protein
MIPSDILHNGEKDYGTYLISPWHFNNLSLEGYGFPNSFDQGSDQHCITNLVITASSFMDILNQSSSSTFTASSSR